LSGWVVAQGAIAHSAEPGSSFVRMTSIQATAKPHPQTPSPRVNSGEGARDTGHVHGPRGRGTGGNGSGALSGKEFDGLHRLRVLTDGQGRRTVSEYDGEGNRISLLEPGQA